MPILQSRVISIISAGLDYQQALRQACAAIDLAAERAIGPDEALFEIQRLKALIFESGLLRHPITSATTLATEDQHFQKSSKYNNRRRNKMRLKRGTLDFGQPTTAPESIYNPEKQQGNRMYDDLAEQLNNPETLIDHSFRNISPERRAAIERQVEMEERADTFKKQYSKKPGYRNNPKDKGLYDPPEDDDGGSIL